ncbi:unnamed protein product [Arctia plantaginis]|uniref:Uncharacterized protein n=1 Tax=Arctia plantaginis TaxID=874455 RepID=A0A8S0Z241_ARCPL|nr:unnamed protein product [Arctia plantaginis]
MLAKKEANREQERTSVSQRLEENKMISGFHESPRRRSKQWGKEVHRDFLCRVHLRQHRTDVTEWRPHKIESDAKPLVATQLTSSTSPGRTLKSKLSK